LKKIKLGIAFIFILSITGSLASEAFGLPPFLVKARKFGAKDCTFCHIEPEGGPPFNERGQWLLAEKERRKAEVVDPEWLAEYKPADKKAGEPAKPAEKPAAPTGQAEKQKVKVDPKVYDAYVGEYETPFGQLSIMKEGDKLFGKPQDDTKEELVPESETEFLVERVKIRIQFVKDDKGQVTHLIMKANGQEAQGKKIK
jgi:hypothetical protein